MQATASSVCSVHEIHNFLLVFKNPCQQINQTSEAAFLAFMTRFDLESLSRGIGDQSRDRYDPLGQCANFCKVASFEKANGPSHCEDIANLQRNIWIEFVP